MKEEYFNTTITVDATPEKAFKCINEVTKWWTENLDGSSQNLHDEFTVRFDDVHVSTQKVVEFLPYKKIAWLVTDSQLNFIEDKQEWTDTKIIFEVSEKNDKAEILFTHEGLRPDHECFNACSNAWTQYLRQSLKNFITKDEGRPSPKK